MKTFKDLKDEIARINNIDVKGFDGEWVLRKFARDQALINIGLIKPYTDEYSTVVRFLVTGKNVDAATHVVATAYAASAASAASAATAYAVASASATYAVATYATYAASAAAYATDATTYADYTKAIATLNALANEYLALLACAE